MVTIALGIIGVFLMAGIILGLFVFGIGAIGTVIIWGFKIGLCAIPFLLGFLLVRMLLF